MGKLRLWTPQDDLLVLDASLSVSDIARRLDRTVPAIHSRRQVLRGTSSRPRWRTKGFPQIPRGHREWLIAKTCPTCGDFLSASEFPVKVDGGRQTYCRSCQSEKVVDRIKSDPAFRARFSANVGRRQRGLQRETSDAARNARKEWTGPELEILARSDLSDKAKSEMLGRSFYAVRHMIRKLRAEDPRITRLAGLSEDA